MLAPDRGGEHGGGRALVLSSVKPVLGRTHQWLASWYPYLPIE